MLESKQIPNYNLVKKEIIDYRDPHTKHTTNYYLNYLHHRTDGPAIEHLDGSKEFYLFGRRHNAHGPAVIFNDRLEYWLDGVRQSINDQPAIIHKYKNEAGVAQEDKEFFDRGVKHRLNGPAEMRADGTIMYYVDGLRHNVNGPAIVYGTNHMIKHMHYIFGKLHNDKGPAVVYKNGSIEHWINNKLHNANGPAVIDSDGNAEYWIHGQLINIVSGVKKLHV